VQVGDPDLSRPAFMDTAMTQNELDEQSSDWVTRLELRLHQQWKGSAFECDRWIHEQRAQAKVRVSDSETGSIYTLMYNMELGHAYVEKLRSLRKTRG